MNAPLPAVADVSATTLWDLDDIVRDLRVARERWRLSQNRPLESGGREFPSRDSLRDIVERLNRVVNQVIAMPDVRTRIFEAGSFPVQPPTSVEQWGSMFRQDVQNWAELVRASGATIN